MSVEEALWETRCPLRGVSTREEERDQLCFINVIAAVFAMYVLRCHARTVVYARRIKGGVSNNRVPRFTY